MKPHPNTKAARLRRLNWMLRHEEVWSGYPNNEKWHERRMIVRAMQRAGVFSKSTYWVDVDLEGYISEARKLRRERAYRRDTGKAYAAK